MSDSVSTSLEAIVESMGGQSRVGQREMAEAVMEAFSAGDNIVVQAGTGTGKSLAYLVPAARMAREKGPVVIATATLALQRQLIERELPRLAEAGGDVSWAVLKGRQNYLCRQRMGEADGQESLISQEQIGSRARGSLEEQAAMVHEWASHTQTGDRDDLDAEIDSRVWRAVSVSSAECVGESRCAFGDECFSAQARARAMEADIVVTNHALLAIDAIEGVPVLPDRSALVVDEAHELVDRITSAVTGELSVSALERLVGDAARVSDDQGSLADAVDDVAIALDELAEANTNSSGRITAWTPALSLALARIRDSTRALASALSADLSATPAAAHQESTDAAALQRVRAGAEDVFAVSGRLLALANSDVVWWSQDGGRGPVLRIAPLSVGDALAESLYPEQPVVLTSATLKAGGSFAPTLTALGLAPDTTCLDVGSGFDYAQQGILYVAGHVPPPNREGASMEALDELADLIEAAGGRTLALFSSWNGVDRAADYLRVRLGSGLDAGDLGPLLVQRRGESVAPVVQRFTSEPQSLLVGTVALWQGIDVPGNSLVLVTIDRIPFPRPDDPVMSARQAAVDAEGRSGFREVALTRAALLLAQGAGRLIRSESDRGVVAVLDPRMATAGYGGALRASLPPLWFTTDGSVVRQALVRLRDDE
jgi:ATP-dependent DNA helicase DinG